VVNPIRGAARFLLPSAVTPLEHSLSALSSSLCFPLIHYHPRLPLLEKWREHIRCPSPPLLRPCVVHRSYQWEDRFQSLPVVERGTEYVHRWFHSTALGSTQVSDHPKTIENTAGSRSDHGKNLNGMSSLRCLRGESLP